MLSYFRLLTGEDMLGETRFVNENNTMVVKNPVRIVISNDPNNQQKINVGLAPWPQFTGTKEITLNRDHVLFVEEPLPEFKAQYSKMFGGLLLPDQGAKLILPK